MSTEEKLLRLLEYARFHCDYYSGLFKNNDINIRNIASFYGIPLLTKKLVQENEREILSDQYNINDLIKEKTSGSTGTPLNCYYDQHERVRRSLALWKIRKTHCADIIGKRMISFHSGNRNHGKDFMKNSNDINIDTESNIAYLNYLNMNNEKMKRYYTFINEYKPYFIRCQPSIFQNFTSYCNVNQLQLYDGIALIELTGEYLFSNVMDLIQNSFSHSKVCNNYGTQEFFCVAYSCKNQNLHLADNQLYVEILNKDSEGFGDIVITSFSNLAMPFIRYKIGDVGRIVECECDCGQFKSPVLEIKSSRVGDFFYLDDKKVHGDIFKRIIEKYNTELGEVIIRQFKIIQISKYSFDVLLIVNNEAIDINGGEYIGKHMQESLFEYLGEKLNIKVSIEEYFNVDSSSGKLKVYNFL